MKDDPYFTLCEAVTWIAFRVPYKVPDLRTAEGMIGDFDFEAGEVQSAAAELKARLSHPKSGILIEGIDENGNREIHESIPHTHFSERIEFYLHDDTIGKSSASLNDVLSDKDFPQWKSVRVLKEDMKREWPEGVYVATEAPDWPDKPYFNAKEAINALAYHDPAGSDRFVASQKEHGINLGDWDTVAIWAGAKKRLQEAALSGKIVVWGLQKHDTEHRPTPATDWFTLKINPVVFHMDTEEQLKAVGADKTNYHPDGENYWRDLQFPAGEIRAFHDEFFGRQKILDDDVLPVDSSKKRRRTDPNEDILIRNNIEMVLAMAKRKWPNPAAAPSYRQMAAMIARDVKYKGEYKASTIESILKGQYKAAKRLGLGSFRG